MALNINIMEQVMEVKTYNTNDDKMEVIFLMEENNVDNW